MFKGRLAIVSGLLSSGILVLAYAKTSAAEKVEGSDNAGLQIYADHCAACHGPSMEGGFGPALAGDAFNAKWQDKEQILLDYIQRSMPPGRAGSLSRQKYSSVAAALLHKNALNAPDEKTQKAVKGDQWQEFNAVTAQNEDEHYRKIVAERSRKLESLSPVSESMLRSPKATDWLHWRRTENGNGFSPLEQINRSNVSSLKFAWSLALPEGKNEIVPIVHDGVMFVNSNGIVSAIDAEDGETLWTYARSLEPSAEVGAGNSQPKSMAIAGRTLYVPTLDNHIIALAIETGKMIWDHTIDKNEPLLRLTGGPIVVGNRVIQGVAGCAFLARTGGCYIVGLDAGTGDEKWRFHTIQRPGSGEADSWRSIPLNQRSGGSVWSAGTYDAETGLVYFGVGQTYHITPLVDPAYGQEKNNDALYTDSTLALDPETGKLIWHYQHMNRDVWDADWAFERIVATIPVSGKPRKVVMTMGKLGILDVLDARTGAYQFSFDVGLQNLVTSIDRVTGKKITDPKLEPNAKAPVFICPSATGVRNWPATAYNSRSRTLYVPMSDSCMKFSWYPGKDYDVGFSREPNLRKDGTFGQLSAISLDKPGFVWSIRRRAPAASAVLATAGGLVFEGTRDRWFRALDDRTGKVLWQVRLDNVPSSFPITFSAGGIQKIALTTGGGNANDSSRQSLTPEMAPTANGVRLWVFDLGK